MPGGDAFPLGCGLSSFFAKIHNPSQAGSFFVSEMVGVAQLVRAPDCGSGGRGFETRHPPHFLLSIPLARISNGFLYVGRRVALTSKEGWTSALRAINDREEDTGKAIALCRAVRLVFAVHHTPGISIDSFRG